jgi:ABC-type arginine transport system ATPase subunit
MPQYKYLAKTHAKNVLIINSVNKADKSNGGAYYMKNGRIVAKVLGDKLLIVDLK